jgi:vacuolar-type H+-ATPase subunit C/Vma6
MKDLKEDLTIYGGKIDKNFPEDFKDVSRDLANNLVKTKYFTNWEDVEKEVNERTKESRFSREGIFNLKELFSHLNFYEISIPLFSKYILREEREYSELRKLGLLKNTEKTDLNHSLDFNLDLIAGTNRRYVKRLNELGSLGADISDLPTELNYLERIN